MRIGRRQQEAAQERLRTVLEEAPTVSVLLLNTRMDSHQVVQHYWRALATEGGQVKDITVDVQNALGLRLSQSPVLCVRTPEQPAAIIHALSQSLFGDSSRLTAIPT